MQSQDEHLSQLLKQNQDEEYFINHPWDRPSVISADMLGSLQDNPLVRAARSLQIDTANAEETAKARLANLRPWETAQGVSSEVFAPIAAQRAAMWGVDSKAPVAPKPPTLFDASHSWLRLNPVTGQLEPAYNAPSKVKEATYKIPLSTDVMGRVSESAPMTASEVREAFAKGLLPQQALDSETVKYILQGQTAAPAASTNSTTTGGGLPLSLGTNSPFAAGFATGAATATTGAKKYQSADEVKSLYQSGSLTRAQAEKVLREQFGFK